jgi:hypothetical protein
MGYKSKTCGRHNCCEIDQKEEGRWMTRLFLVYFLYDNEIYKVENENGELWQAATSTTSTGGSRWWTGTTAGSYSTSLYRCYIWQGERESQTLIISPLVRCINAPCCGKTNHVTNYGEADFALMFRRSNGGC